MHQIRGCASLLCCINSMHRSMCRDNFIFAQHRIYSTEGFLDDTSYQSMLICCSLSKYCFICCFPEIVVSSMVNQNSLHANCFYGVSLTFKVV